MNELTIAFIGGGNMAGSMIGGLLARGRDATSIRVSDPQPASRERLAALGVAAHESNLAAASGSDIVVLAVKPQQLRAACLDIAPAVRAANSLVISIAAGIETRALETWLGEDTQIVRCMPNTPAMLQCGATVLYATPRVGAQARRVAHAVLESVGFAAWVDREDLMHAVTALSGSGPAYFFLLMEAMQDAASTLGMDADLARRLTAQTALGAARMALESDVDVAELRRRVTSPGGTTERALRVFEKHGLRQLVESALAAAAERSSELSSELGAS